MPPDANAPQTASDSKARLRLWLALLRTANGIEAEVRRRFRDHHDTTLPRFDVMAALARHPEGLKMSNLSSALRVSNGNVTGIVDRLTQDGLAERVAVAGDRRAHLARLTPAGVTTFETLAADHEAWVNQMLDHIDGPQAEILRTQIGLMPLASQANEAEDTP